MQAPSKSLGAFFVFWYCGNVNYSDTSNIGKILSRHKNEIRKMRFYNLGKYHYFNNSTTLFESEFYTIECEVEKFNGLFWVVE